VMSINCTKRETFKGFHHSSHSVILCAAHLAGSFARLAGSPAVKGIQGVARVLSDGLDS